jgi:alginate O-acetyltransferase complex protein AlgI
MLFNSLEFLIYFPVVVTVYFLIPHRLRWVWLLGASYWFYMAWKPVYALVLVAITIIDFVSGISIERATTQRSKRLFLTLSIVSNLSILFFFKYFNFLNDTLRALVGLAGAPYPIPALDVILPIGISFHTFQSLSYTIDVYLGRKEPERHFGIFALFVAFFPQLVAGPIERATTLLPQFRERHRFVEARVVSGLRLMLWGFFKKLVIADRLAVYVNDVYGSPESHEGGRLLLATYFFAVQIFCDFSGYTDIARGAARVMGYELVLNFDRPYHAASISEFWRRWHISLSTWFRDYLYIPLGGSRLGYRRHLANLMIVFLVSGLWHGANWTFVVWGALHGSYMVASVVTSSARERIASSLRLDRAAGLRRALGVAITFHLVLFAWIFFRAPTFASAMAVVTGIFGGVDLRIDSLVLPGFDRVELLLAAVSIVLLEAVHLAQGRSSVEEWLAALPWPCRWACYHFLVLATLFFGRFDEQEFIYFQF